MLSYVMQTEQKKTCMYIYIFLSTKTWWRNTYKHVPLGVLSTGPASM